MDKIGLTKDAGWQYGIRRTVDLPLEEVWDYLFSKNGFKIWADQVQTDFSTFKKYSHIRTKWKMRDWDDAASLQLRVLSNSRTKKTTIALHIDQIRNELHRDMAKKYWTGVLTKIIENLSSP